MKKIVLATAAAAALGGCAGWGPVAAYHDGMPGDPVVFERVDADGDGVADSYLQLEDCLAAVAPLRSDVRSVGCVRRK